jgi:hypothetical protein
MLDDGKTNTVRRVGCWAILLGTVWAISSSFEIPAVFPLSLCICVPFALVARRFLRRRNAIAVFGLAAFVAGYVLVIPAFLGRRSDVSLVDAFVNVVVFLALWTMIGIGFFQGIVYLDMLIGLVDRRLFGPRMERNEVERIRLSPPMMSEKLQDDRQVCLSSPKRRPWQFSLRSLFVLTTVVAVLLSLAKVFPAFGLILAAIVGSYFLSFVGFAMSLGFVFAQDALIKRFVKLLSWTRSILKKRVVSETVHELRSCTGDGTKRA